MTGLNRALLAIALAAIVAGGAAAALIVSSDHTPMPGAGIVIGLLISWSFVGTGLYAWWRRPASRFGALMTAVGFTYMLAALTASDDSVVFTIGVLLASLYFVVFAHMLLAYPDGRLERRWHAWLLAGGLRPVPDRPAAAAAVGLQRADDRQLPRLPGVGAADRAQRHAAGRPQRPPVGDRRGDRRGGAGHPDPPLARRHAAAAAVDGADPVVRRGDAGAARHRAGQRRRRHLAPDRRARVGQPARLRVGAVGVPDRTRAQPRGARRRRLRAPAAARRGARHRHAALPALPGARRPLAAARVLARGQGPLGRLRRPRRRAAHRGRHGAGMDRRRARGPPCRRHRARRDAVPRTPSCWARWPPPPAWRWRTSACRRSCAPASRSCAPRARGSSRPARTSAGGWSATCTTAPSSASSRSR